MISMRRARELELHGHDGTPQIRCMYMLLCAESDVYVALSQDCDRLKVGWAPTVRKDLEWIQGILPGKLGSFPSPRNDIATWASSIFANSR